MFGASSTLLVLISVHTGDSHPAEGMGTFETEKACLHEITGSNFACSCFLEAVNLKAGI